MPNGDDDIMLEPESGEGEGTPEQKLKELRDTLKKALAERDEYLAGWQRSKADYINARKRAEEERDVLSGHITEKLIKGLLPALDSFEHALATTETDDQWLSGIKNTYTQLMSALKEYGVTQFDPVGEEFNPTKHEPVETVAVSEKEKDNIVTLVRQKGYEIQGKVIRPARVQVGHYEENKKQ